MRAEAESGSPPVDLHLENLLAALRSEAGERHSASGSGRSWKWMIALRLPWPPSMCQFRFDP